MNLESWLERQMRRNLETKPLSEEHGAAIRGMTLGYHRVLDYLRTHDAVEDGERAATCSPNSTVLTGNRQEEVLGQGWYKTSPTHWHDSYGNPFVRVYLDLIPEFPSGHQDEGSYRRVAIVPWVRRERPAVSVEA